MEGEGEDESPPVSGVRVSVPDKGAGPPTVEIAATKSRAPSIMLGEQGRPGDRLQSDAMWSARVGISQ